MPVISQLKQHKLLLDTHVFLWLAKGSTTLTRPFVNAAKRARDRSQLFISAISIWEIGMLCERGRIELGMDPLDFVEEMLSESHIELLPLTPPIAIESSRLPGKIHGDPADRILVATAHEHHAVLVTKDSKLLTYGKNKYLKVHNPASKKANP